MPNKTQIIMNLPELPILRRAAPIGRINAAFDKALEGRIRPSRRGGGVTMFDRVPMDVIAMPLKIAFIADAMLPKAPLPHRLLALGAAGGGNRRLYCGAQWRVNSRLIDIHRLEKSSSPSGNVHRQWRWSGSNTSASMVKGWRTFTVSNARRNSATLPASANNGRRSNVTTVKK